MSKEIALSNSEYAIIHLSIGYFKLPFLPSCRKSDELFEAIHNHRLVFKLNDRWTVKMSVDLWRDTASILDYLGHNQEHKELGKTKSILTELASKIIVQLPN